MSFLDIILCNKVGLSAADGPLTIVPSLLVLLWFLDYLTNAFIWVFFKDPDIYTYVYYSKRLFGLVKFLCVCFLHE